MEGGGLWPPLPSGQLAQLVQSAALTGRRSLVRAQYCSQKRRRKAPFLIHFLVIIGVVNALHEHFPIVDMIGQRGSQ